jgi:hypothetical protein
MTKEGECFKAADTLIKSFNKRYRVGWTVICDPVEY